MKIGSLFLGQNRFARFVTARSHTIVEIISALFILLFVYTALSKFSTFEGFRYVLKESPLIGAYNEIVAWALPTTELLVSALLFIPRTRLIGLYSSFVLMSVFTLYLGYMIAFTPNKPCNCGGVLKQMTWSQHLVFNIFFTLLALAGIWLSKVKTHTKSFNEPVIFT